MEIPLSHNGATAIAASIEAAKERGPVAKNHRSEFVSPNEPFRADNSPGLDWARVSRVTPQPQSPLRSSQSERAAIGGFHPLALQAPRDDYRPAPVSCFSFSSCEIFSTCANAAVSANPSALATARVATGFNHSNAMKAAVMSQAIMT